MKLGTKLTLYLSLFIVIVLSAYGYFHILSRRDILIRKMKVEVETTGRNLKVSLEKVGIEREREYVQDLIDSVEEYERTLGVVVYYQGKNLTFASRSLEGDVGPYLELIRHSIKQGEPQEEFRSHKKAHIFAYAFPLQDKKGKNMGGVSILQHISFLEEDIKRAEWSIFITILILIGGTVAFVLLGTRKWVAQPISKLMGGIQNMAKGNLETQIKLKGRNELSELARAFNQMAVDLKEAQERIIQESENKLELERNLKHSEKLATIGQLASGLAHEIGTPLNIISGRAELMQRRLEDKEGLQRNLEIIVQQTERITKIIKQLLGFVRKKKPEQKVLNLSVFLETLLDFLDHQIQKQGVRVVKEMGDVPPPVMGDPDQLQQVFLNLILNAIQSMPEGGTLHLSVVSKWVSRDGVGDDRRQYVVVRVEDTGLGMGKEVLQNIFNPFFTTKETGTGLGLMVSQGIIQDHEGWIDVKSEVGKGSVFEAYLPSLQREESDGGQGL